ncbi:hypothetical protein EJ05DRAFT_226108 [Pseudovirgaria hyperparasitica]|uniref:Uncharacterized protein n=1 Tax=Pseudovirgaria hyperparasitica TaxID=470096 RepID=A0A6A6VSI4_9PEZI|nr:uncharacterized protein EJ05DRAFT_226108 [Pseudovirgaria hyperparasitica]KAF2753115.1 hypothetical protein EJ05DRAFT_226108 [Pseudovirgaria hyperparasitica]
MPTYRSAGTSVYLRTASLRHSTTTNPEKKKGQNATEASDRAAAALLGGSILRERALSDHPSDHISFLGQSLNVPFFLRGVVYDAVRDTSDHELSPHALAVQVTPSKGTFLKDLKSSTSMPAGGRAAQDLMISVFFNGNQCNSKYIPARSANRPEELMQCFSGCRFTFMLERPWVIIPDGQEPDGSMRPLKRRKSGMLSAEDRWTEISAEIARESARYGYNEHGERQPLGDYLQCLAAIPMPGVFANSQRAGGQKFGVIDVVVSLGRGKKRDTSNAVYMKSPSYMLDSRYSFETPEDAPLYKPKTAQNYLNTPPSAAPALTMDLDDSPYTNERSIDQDLSTLSETFAALEPPSSQGKGYAVIPPPTPHLRSDMLASHESLDMSTDSPDYISSPGNSRHRRGGIRVQSVGEKGLDQDNLSETMKRICPDSFDLSGPLSEPLSGHKRQCVTATTGSTRPSHVPTVTSESPASPLRSPSSLSRIVISSGGSVIVNRELSTPKFLDTPQGVKNPRSAVEYDEHPRSNLRNDDGQSELPAPDLSNPKRESSPLTKPKLTSTAHIAASSGAERRPLFVNQPSTQHLTAPAPAVRGGKSLSDAPWRIPPTNHRRRTNNSFGAYLPLEARAILKSERMPKMLLRSSPPETGHAVTDDSIVDSKTATHDVSLVIPSAPVMATATAPSLRTVLRNKASARSLPTPAISIPLRRQNSTIHSTSKLNSVSAMSKRKQSVGSVNPKGSGPRRRGASGYTVETVPNFEVPELSLDSIITYAKPTVLQDASIGPLGIVRQIRSERPGDFQESGVLCAFRYVITAEDIFNNASA